MKNSFLRRVVFALLPIVAFVASAPALSAADTIPSVDPLRLTHDMEPVAQAVHLTIDPAQDSYSGNVTINLVARREITSFRLHAVGQTLASPQLTDISGHSVPLTVVVNDAELGLTTLSSATPIPAGSYVFTVSFTAKFSRDGMGIYKTVSRGDPYLFTQFEDRYARRAFPCWDEPEFKIPWQVTLTVPANLEAVSNATPALESRDGTNKTISFGRTPPMPSYLVAMSVGPFEFTPITGMSVPGRVVTPRGQSAFASEAAKVSPALLAHLETYFGIPYSYAKLDLNAVPEYVFGAMENAGLITFVDSLLLMDPKNASFSDRRRMANVVAHEMAHMWFGDLVTMRWWEDLWLNESFADWMCAKIIAETHPEFRIELDMLRDIHGAMRTDALPSVTPIRRPLTARDDPSQVVDELTYNKGKAILRMVESWIGPEKFRAAMHSYFTKHRWGNTVAGDLWNAFTETSGENVTGMLAPFIEKPGIPLVSVALRSDGKLELSQSRFSNLGSGNLSGRWQVPVVLAWSKAGRVQRERILLTNESQTVDIPGVADADWIYPNAGEAGYYRWTLSPELTTKLAARSSALSTIERYGLLDNVASLLNAGRLAGADYLAYLAAFAHDEEPEIVVKVAAGLGYVRETFVRSEKLAAFHALRTALLKPALQRIGLKPVSNEPAHVSPMRATLFLALGMETADPEVIATARELTAQYLRDPSSVDASLARASLNVAAYHGDPALFAALQEAITKAISPDVRANAIGGLGNFSDPKLAAQALDYSLNGTLNSTEFLRVAANLGEINARREQVVDWIMKNFPAIKAKAPPLRLAGLIVYGEGAEPALFEKFRKFLLEPANTTQAAQANIVKAADRVSLRTQLRDKEQTSVESYLSTFPANVKDKR